MSETELTGQIDAIVAARIVLRKAQFEVDAAAEELKERKAFLKLSQQRLLAAIDERDQPSIPFDVPAKSWRDMTLVAAGFIEGADAWPERMCEAITGCGVSTCGQLADRLLGGEMFELDVSEIQPVYAAIEMLSEDDAEPINFDAHFGKLAAPPPVQPSAGAATFTMQLGMPDWIFDALLTAGISTLPTLLERVAEKTNPALSLRNRIAAYLVSECGAKLRLAQVAADAVADRIESDPQAAAEAIAVLGVSEMGPRLVEVKKKGKAK